MEILGKDAEELTEGYDTDWSKTVAKISDAKNLLKQTIKKTKPEKSGELPREVMSNIEYDVTRCKEMVNEMQKLLKDKKINIPLVKK